MKKYYIVIAIIWLVAVFLMILTVGNPFTRRKEVIDKTIVNDMNRWSNTIGDYYSEYRRLPKDLKDIDRQKFYIYLEGKGTEIDYKITGEYKYQLCAEFLTDTTGNNLVPFSSNTHKKHKQGYDCIDFEVPSSVRTLPVYISLTPTPPSASSELRSQRIFVRQEYGVSESSRYLQADIPGNMYPEYTKDEDSGGKTIIHLQGGKPLLELTVVNEGSPTHFLSHEKIDESELYLVSVESEDSGNPEYYYTYSVSVETDCSNKGVINKPCGPIDINGIVIHFVGDLEDIEIANKFVASLKFL